MSSDSEIEDAGRFKDPLDAVLEQAKWPDPGPERLARLEDAWGRIQCATRHRGSSGWSRARLVAAAAVVLAASLIVIRYAVLPDAFDRRPVPNAVAAPRPDDLRPLPPQEFERQQRAPEPRPEEGVELAAAGGRRVTSSREPTAYEQLVLAAAMRRQIELRPGSNTAEPDELDKALDTLAADPQADLDTLVAPLLAERQRHEQRLLAMIPHAGPERLPAMTSILAHLGTPRSLPALRFLANWPDTHEAALPGLARLEQPLALARWIEQETDDRLRRQLLGALARRDDVEAAQRFLGFVEDPQTRHFALESLREASPSAIELCFEALTSPRPELRRAAARVLGRLDGPSITERLIWLVYDSPYRQDALSAIIFSDGPEAEQFLASARDDMFLVASVRAAEVQLREEAHRTISKEPEL